MNSEQWDALRQGKREALDAIYQAHVQMLFRYGCKFTTHRHVVEDCIHDLFVELWQRHATLGPTDSIKFYLLRVLRRKLAQRVKRDISHSIAERQFCSNQVNDLQFAWLLKEEDQQREHTLQQLVNALPPRQREMIYLRFYSGLSFSEAADILDIDVRSAYNLTYKALSALRRYVEKNPSLPSLLSLLAILLTFHF